MANKELITDFIDERAFEQFERLKRELKESQDDFSELVKVISALNIELSKSKNVDSLADSIENVSKASNRLAEAEEKTNTAYKKTTEAQQQVIEATKSRIEASNMDISVLQKVAGNLDEQIKRQVTLKAELKAVRDEQKELTKAVASSDKSQRALANRTQVLAKEETLLKEQIRQTNLEVRRRVREETAAVGSSDQLAARLDQLRGAYRSLNSEERESADVGGALLTQINELDKELKELDATQGVYNRNVGNYVSGNEEVVKSLSTIFPELERVRASYEKGKNVLQSLSNVIKDYVNGNQAAASATNTLTTAQTASNTATTAGSKALKLFRIALVSTGIGAVVVALGSLIAYLTTTQEGIDAVTRITRPLQAIFKSLIGVLQNVGESLFNAFTNPKKAIEDIYNYVSGKVIKTFQAFGTILRGIVGLDFDKIKQGFSDLTEDIVDAGKEVGGFFSDAAKAGAEIDKITKDIERSEIRLIENRGKLNRLIEEEREKTRDASLAASERAKAAENATKALNQLTQLQLDIQDKRIEKLKLEQSLNRNKLSDDKELAELEAERENIAANAARTRSRITSRLNSANRELNKSIKDNSKEEEKALKIKESAENKIYELAQRKLEAEQKTSEYISSILKKEAQDTEKSFDERLESLNDYVKEKESSIEASYAREQLKEEQAQKEISKLRIEGRIEEAKALQEITKINLEESARIEQQQRQELAEETLNIQSKLLRDNLETETQERLQMLDSISRKELLELEKNYTERNITTEQYERERLNIQRRYADTVLAIEIESIQKIIDENKKKGIAVKSEEEKLAELKIKLSKQTTDQQIEDLQKLRDKEKETSEARKELSQELFNLGQSLFQAQFDREQMRVEQQLEDLERETELRRNAVEQEVLSEEDKRIRLAEIEAESIAKRNQLENKQRQIQMRQARFDRAISISNIIGSTAEGVMRALARGNIPLSVIIGATGAAQLASVLAQPLPRFFTGTDSSPEGLAHVGEKGTELMVTPDGSLQLTPNRDTITYLQKGTKIFDADKTKQILAFSGMPKSQGQETQIDVSKIVDATKKSTSEIKKAILSRPEHRTVLTKRGLRNVYKNGSTWNNYKNNLLN